MRLKTGPRKKPRGINMGDNDRGRVMRFRASFGQRLVNRLPLGGSEPNDPREVILGDPKLRGGNGRIV